MLTYSIEKYSKKLQFGYTKFLTIYFVKTFSRDVFEISGVVCVCVCWWREPLSTTEVIFNDMTQLNKV